MQEAGLIYRLNGSKLGIAQVGRLAAAIRVRDKDYAGAVVQLEDALRSMRDGGAAGGGDEADLLWAMAVAKRLRGDADEGREDARSSAEVQVVQTLNSPKITMKQPPVPQQNSSFFWLTLTKLIPSGIQGLWGVQSM